MLSLVPTPIGNLEDISKRALDTLLEAELIFCEDTRVTKRLLHLFQEKYNLTFPCTEFKSLHSHNEDKVLKTLSKDDFEKNIVYVSDAGMPCVSDPGASLVQFAIENDIKYDVIPGANAVLTAFAMSGFPQTEFTFFGFLAHKGTERKEKVQKVMNSPTLPILYEAPHRLQKLLEELKNIDENRTIFLAKELTKQYQTIFKDSAINIYNKLKESSIKGEWVVVIEPVETIGSSIELEDIKELDLAPKIKAKLIAKLTGRKIKEVYQELSKK